MQILFRLLLVFAYLTSLVAHAEESEKPFIVGTSAQDRLLGTIRSDDFVGKDGPDVFVINYLSETPDRILDFDATEGDSLELAFTVPKSQVLETEHFTINRKGVVTVDLAGKVQPVVDLMQSNLQLALDVRKGRYFLEFSKKF